MEQLPFVILGGVLKVSLLEIIGLKPVTATV